ncbi:L-carnitine dehydrogenase [Nymphon striatum]|nr:L-carnitine dehydrogenase [Nymphon striatum]
MLEKYSSFQHEWEPEFLEMTRDFIFRNTFADLEYIVKELGQVHGTRFEFECYDLGHLYNLAWLLDQGWIEGTVFVQMVFGVLGGVGADLDNLMHMHSIADKLFGDSYEWSVLAAGRHQMNFATQAAMLGGNLRVGMEDSLYIGPGQLTPSNAAQVTKIRTIIEALGLQVATPTEARDRLQLKGADNTVAVYDIDPNAEFNVRQYVDTAWPVLEELGLTKNGNPDAVTFHTNAADAVRDAAFVQESVPERLDVKHALYRDIESSLHPNAIVASSASGLTLTEMQGGWSDPARFVLGHPFNPPHLIPLVEVLGNDHTGNGVVAEARSFYESVGKVTIEVRKEVPGHVANRLQAALWREAISLVTNGVASVEDVDTAVWAGPGLRWAAMGPNMLFHLGAGEGGLTSFCERYSDSFNQWWDDLGVLHLDSDVAAQLVAGVAEAAGSVSVTQLSAERDALLSSILQATAGHRAP